MKKKFILFLTASLMIMPGFGAKNSVSAVKPRSQYSHADKSDACNAAEIKARIMDSYRTGIRYFGLMNKLKAEKKARALTVATSQSKEKDRIYWKFKKVILVMKRYNSMRCSKYNLKQKANLIKYARSVMKDLQGHKLVAMRSIIGDIQLERNFGPINTLLAERALDDLCNFKKDPNVYKPSSFLSICTYNASSEDEEDEENEMKPAECTKPEPYTSSSDEETDEFFDEVELPPLSFQKGDEDLNEEGICDEEISDEEVDDEGEESLSIDELHNLDKSGALSAYIERLMNN